MVHQVLEILKWKGQRTKKKIKMMLVILSFLVRTLVTLGLFLAAGQGHAGRIGICLVGFVVARFLVIRITREKAPESEVQAGKEVGDAAQP